MENPVLLLFRKNSFGRIVQNFYKGILLTLFFVLPFFADAQSNQLPSVYIIPPDTTNFTAPASISLSAIAYDPDGSIIKVEYFLCSTKLAEVTTEPYTIIIKSMEAGSYTFTAKATDNSGGVMETCLPVTVGDPDDNCDPEITADFENTNVCQGSNVSFWSTSSGDPYPNTFEWKVNGVIISTGSSMNYTFGSPGNYTVRLRTGFNTLCATKTKIITVTDIAGPINGVSEVCANQQDVAYSIPAVAGASYDWWVNGGTATISGDGTNSVSIDFGQNFTDIHVGVNLNDCYKESVLTLTMAPNCGGGPDSCNTQSAFGRSQACFNQTTSFWDLSTGTHDTYSWKINGTEVSTANNLQYTFTDTSTYVIEFGVGTGGNICSNSSQIIMLPETAGPIMGDSIVCRGQDYTFSLDPNPNASYNWWLNGDGSVISGQGTNQATVHIGNFFNTSDVRVGVNFGSCYKESGKILTAQNCGARMAAANAALLTIMPHPFEEQTIVSVETGETIFNVKVYAVNGKEVFNSGKVNKEVITIGETLAAGYYIIHVVTETDTYIKTLVKF